MELHMINADRCSPRPFFPPTHFHAKQRAPAKPRTLDPPRLLVHPPHTGPPPTPAGVPPRPHPRGARLPVCRRSARVLGIQGARDGRHTFGANVRCMHACALACVCM
eukprot:366008-Chlamydomonas_euryale.AAC.4